MGDGEEGEMIVVIRELVYTYPDASAYLADKARWTAEFKRPDGMTMRSITVSEREYPHQVTPDDPALPD